MQPFTLLPASGQTQSVQSACEATACGGMTARSAADPFARVPDAFQDASSDEEDGDGDVKLSSASAAKGSRPEVADQRIRAEAVQFAEAGKLGHAITRFKQFLKYNAGDAAAWEMLAQLQMETEQMFDAVKVRGLAWKRGRNTCIELIRSLQRKPWSSSQRGQLQRKL